VWVCVCDLFLFFHTDVYMPECRKVGVAVGGGELAARGEWGACIHPCVCAHTRMYTCPVQERGGGGGGVE